MTEPIRGKVARVLGPREIVLNIGTAKGITVGMPFDIMDIRENISGSNTGETLSSSERPKARVRVIYTQENFSVAVTEPLKQAHLGPAAQSFIQPTWVRKYEALKKKTRTTEKLAEQNSLIKRGDPVVQVAETGRKNWEERLALARTRKRAFAMPFLVGKSSRSRNR